MPGKLSPRVAFIIAGSIAPMFAPMFSQGQVVYNAGGFDSTSRFNTTYTNPLDPTVIGNLRGQDAGVDQWKEAGTASGTASSTAVIENTNYDSASQAVLVTYAGTDNRWAPPINIIPSAAKPDVVVTWNEKFSVPTTPTIYGPFFGIEGYDATTTVNNAADLLGALGIDASNDQVNYFDAGGIETGPTITPGVFHSFSLDFNYASQTFTATVDNQLIIAGDSFVNPQFQATNFTDADIDALNVGGSDSAVGTAIFDDYSISSTPEPTSLLLFGVGTGLVAIRRRRRGV